MQPFQTRCETCQWSRSWNSEIDHNVNKPLHKKMRWKFRSRKKINLIRFESFNVLIDNKMIFMDSFPFYEWKTQSHKKVWGACNF